MVMYLLEGSYVIYDMHSLILDPEGDRLGAVGLVELFHNDHQRDMGMTKVCTGFATLGFAMEDDLVVGACFEMLLQFGELVAVSRVLVSGLASILLRFSADGSVCVAGPLDELLS